jgi:Tfp pilus assembly protein PilX
MSRPIPFHAQRGVTLVIGLIMLVLITLMVTTAFTLSTTNLKSVGNMQYRNEAIAAGNVAIERVLSSPFSVAPTAEQLLIDINSDGTNDYTVSIATPVCVRGSVAAPPVLSSVTLGTSMSTQNTWNTVWDIDATVTPTSDNPGASGVSAHVHSGVRVLLSQAEKNAVCP